MIPQFSIRRIIGSFIVDLLATLLALLLATILRVAVESEASLLLNLGAILERVSIIERWPLSLLQTPVFFLIPLIWPFFFAVFGVYDGTRSSTRKKELGNVFLAVSTAVFVLTGVLFFTYRGTSRLLVLIFIFLDLLTLLGWRFVFFFYLSITDHQRRSMCKQVLIVGAGEVGQRVAQELSKYAKRDIRILAFLDDDPAKIGQELAGYPIVGGLDHIFEFTQTFQVHYAVLTLPLRAHQRLIHAARKLQDAGVRVQVVPDLFTLSFPNASLEGFGGIPVIDLGAPGLQTEQRAVKRFFDLLATSVGLILISPLLLIIALLIKLDSPGPVFYKQKRIGENGIPFRMYKLRSMKVDTDESLHKQHVTRLIRENLDPEQWNGGKGGSLKMGDDSRITRVGHFIRATSIDELPQLFNVLRGEMSLVGPRPPVPYEYSIYQDWHKRRLEAPPGITGLWQVRVRNQVSFDEMVRLDLEYIENHSFWLDIKLLLQTPWAVIKGKGAG